MSELQAVTIGGSTVGLSQAKVDGFRKKLQGGLVLATDHGYDALRQVWNGQIDRRPALIARVAGAKDIAAAVNFARDNELLVSVRGFCESCQARPVPQ